MWMAWRSWRPARKLCPNGADVLLCRRHCDAVQNVPGGNARPLSEGRERGISRNFMLATVIYRTNSTDRLTGLVHNIPALSGARLEHLALATAMLLLAKLRLSVCGWRDAGGVLRHPFICRRSQSIMPRRRGRGLSAGRRSRVRGRGRPHKLLPDRGGCRRYRYVPSAWPRLPGRICRPPP